MKDVTLGSPSKAEKYRKSLEFVSETILSGDKALSLIIEQKLSRGQHQSLRNISLENNCKLYPYKEVLITKRKYYPDKLSITITECSAEVKLQALLDHTVGRILSIQMDVIKSLGSKNLNNLICKWSCDGSFDQSIYKQKFSDDDESNRMQIFFSLHLSHSNLYSKMKLRRQKLSYRKIQDLHFNFVGQLKLNFCTRIWKPL